MFKKLKDAMLELWGSEDFSPTVSPCELCEKKTNSVLIRSVDSLLLEYTPTKVSEQKLFLFNFIFY